MVDGVLKIPVVGPYGQVDGLEKELQVAAARAGEEGGVLALADRTVEGGGEFGGAHPYIALQALGVSFLLFEIEHAAECIVEAGIESRTAQLDVFDETHVEDTGRSTCAALGGEVVDLGNLNAVEVIDVFVGRAAADDDIVAETAHAAGCSTHTGQ